MSNHPVASTPRNHMPLSPSSEFFSSLLERYGLDTLAGALHFNHQDFWRSKYLLQCDFAKLGRWAQNVNEGVRRTAPRIKRIRNQNINIDEVIGRRMFRQYRTRGLPGWDLHRSGAISRLPLEDVL